ncbi:GNAT family N-acetyltransferase [Aquibacillus halophilus]|uniref:GNAT family N-acetyltransferase n=1 Tax=Aquibacillus halophilus TaxID=930132 RepID=A0A6A8DIN2_9BACI|nr:GNAT family N-acetyltransferase [Aquibacillus halophilus]MRH43659.1 GNAT family N-acetyltransferase [Aquibacillus halophilus]
MIRLAKDADLTKIMDIVKNSVKVMNQKGNFQWDETYPLATNYQEDIDRKELYIYEESGQIKGVITISENEHSEYPSISWSSPVKALTIKRLAVNPEARGGDISGALFLFAEKVAKEKEIPYLKTDTFSKNSSAQRLFDKNGYLFVQAKEVKEKGDSLLYFEKFL